MMMNEAEIRGDVAAHDRLMGRVNEYCDWRQRLPPKECSRFDSIVDGEDAEKNIGSLPDGQFKWFALLAFLMYRQPQVTTDVWGDTTR